MADKKKELFEVNRLEQYRTVDELIEKSKASPAFYTLLVLSSLIIAAGLLVGNAAIVIGGMLITPVLTPILLMGLGISVGDITLLRSTARLLLRALGIVMGAAFLLGIIFRLNGDIGLFALDNTLRGAVLYFIVALASGFAATFAWIRKEMNEILPGIAVAVSLVPPLAIVGLGLSVLNFDIIRSNFFVFFFNLLGVVVGSLLVFSLLKFYKVEKKVEREAEQQKKEQEEKVEAAAEKKAAKKRVSRTTKKKTSG